MVEAGLVSDLDLAVYRAQYGLPQSTFGVQGFGRASRVYFGKDLGSITLPEVALLAGLIQSPRTRDPFRFPERAKARRNLILRGIYVGSRQMFEAMNRAIAAHRIDPVIDRVFGFDEAADAYRHLKSQAHLGKVVIRISE